MTTFFRFAYELLATFFSGLIHVFKSIYEGFLMTFNFKKYAFIMGNYSKDFNGLEWVFVVLTIIILLAIILGFFFLIYLLLKKYLRIRKTLIEQESLLKEVGELNKQVLKLSKEKDEILAMKVSQLGLKPEEETEEEEETKEENKGDIRFSKLHDIDLAYQNIKPADYQNSFTLPELVSMFRNFAASELKLYYSEDLIRLFISALASTKLIILQGISGTGKTSLAYAWGKFLSQDSCVASVQPSWRDRTELFGYFNEFTKKFNETDVLREIYLAGYTNDIHTIILDEMNIARVEYYFAEMLSILEMPNKDEWIVELVSSSWPSDPLKIERGKLKIAPNVWYIGTINNDDSTFMVTDKVYDRAMPIDINEKGKVFTPDEVPSQHINYTYLQNLFDTALSTYSISNDNLAKIEAMDDYVIQHFRIAFGNRIVAHLKKFVPVYMACNGDEVAGIDYFIARKILRKFEQLNISYIRDEVDGFIDYLNETFGENKMKECIDYLTRLKKSI